MLEVTRQLKVQKLVLTLSSGMYPADAPIPIKEDYIHSGPAHESNYSYAYAKRLVEPAIRAYRTEFGLNVIGLVPNGIFGENDNFDPDSATFIAALTRRFYENRDNDREIVVWGDGSPLREVTYSKDMARAFLWCLFHYDSPEILNVGTTEEHSIKEIAFMIADLIGIDKNRIVFDVSKPTGVFRRSTDNSRFVQLSHFRHSPIREGIENTLSWLGSNYETLLVKNEERTLVRIVKEQPN
jgi:GDP-L-fucose synthase